MKNQKNIKVKRAKPEEISSIAKIVQQYHYLYPAENISHKARECAKMGCFYMALDKSEVIGFRIAMMSEMNRLMEYLFIKEGYEEHEVHKKLVEESVKHDRKINTLFLANENFKGFMLEKSLTKGDSSFLVYRRFLV